MIRNCLSSLLSLLILGCYLSASGAEQEQVLFFDARADQTGSTNGGTAIWSLKTNTWRWWYQNVKQANVSPNGKFVVYIFNNNLFLSNIRGQTPRLLSTQASFPVWSPQGDKIAFFESHTTLRIVSPDGTQLQSFPNLDGGYFVTGGYHPPSWSPDGRKIAYTATASVPEVGCELFAQNQDPCPRFRQLPTVFALDLATGTKTQLFTPSYVSVEAGSFVVGNTTYTTLISEEITMGVPVWSPDGSRIAAARTILRWYSYPPPESGITPGFRLIEANVVTIPASGGYASLITSDINPSPFLDATVRRNTPGSWSADGRLFYTKTRGASVPVAEQGTYVISGSGPATKINGFVGSSLQWTDLNQSGVAVEIQLPKLRFRTGESFDATVQVTSREDSTQRVSFVETLLKSEDSGVLRVGAVELPTPFDLTPLNWRRAFTVPVVATNEGVTELVSRISVAGPTGPAQELTARLAVKVFPAGDLLIKRAKEPASAFAGNDLYLEHPDGRQTRFVTNARRDTNNFHLRIQNDSAKSASFRLRAVAPDAEDWRITFRHGAVDISANVFSPAGWQTPELAPGALTDVHMEIHDVAAEEGDQVSVTVLLASLDDPETIDSVIAVASMVAVPVETEMRRVTTPGYTAASIAAGSGDVDAPLELVTSKSVLAEQPLIYGGWVADGVTPMLLQMSSTAKALEPFPEGRQFRVDLKIDGGGTIDGVSLTNRLKLLLNGSWVANHQFELKPGAPFVFAMLTPVEADELMLSGDNELTIGVTVVDVVSGEEVSQITLRLRKPPVVLIHGYNTPGDWEDAFILELSRSRPLPVDDFRWVRVAKYGVSQTSGAYVSQMINTLYPLDELVPMAEQAYDEALAPLREQWAFTRFDAVCHSQGGLLTRMLCSQSTSRTLTRPFRNELNHYRGRFHRVVTLGSPHNGTRLLRYLLALNETKLGYLKVNLPKLIGYAGVFSEVAQAKFDPFGVQIRDLNNPSPGSRWKPDPAAKFHLVRTTINRGRPPYAEDLAPSYLALGLFHPVGGPDVLPRGSDGVVDFDSMGAHGPNQAVGANVFTLTPDLLVSHSPPLEVFGAGVGQTASPDVGAHVIAALDQNPAIPSAERVFSSFVIPELLEDSIRQQIDHWADVSIFEFVGSAISEDQAGLQLQAAGAGATTSLRFVLNPPPHLPATNQVMWSVEAFTADGISSEGVELEVNPADSLRVTVQIPSDLVGDVVLYANYLTTNGAVVLAEPRRIFSTEPQGVTLVGIEVQPNEVQLPVGSEIPIQLWARYSDGGVIQRHVQPGEVSATSSATNVVSTTNAVAWRLVGAGDATISVSYRGLSATNRLTAFTPIPPDAPSLIVDRQTDQVLLRWPSTATNYVLESAAGLSPTNTWQTVSGSPTILGGERFVTDSITGSQRYYRLRQE